MKVPAPDWSQLPSRRLPPGAVAVIVTLVVLGLVYAGTQYVLREVDRVIQEEGQTQAQTQGR